MSQIYRRPDDDLENGLRGRYLSPVLSSVFLRPKFVRLASPAPKPSSFLLCARSITFLTSSFMSTLTPVSGTTGPPRRICLLIPVFPRMLFDISISRRYGFCRLSGVASFSCCTLWFQVRPCLPFFELGYSILPDLILFLRKFGPAAISLRVACQLVAFEECETMALCPCPRCSAVGALRFS